MKILLAEDDKNLGRLLQNLLKKENIKTDWVEDGEAAYEQCYRDGYDVLILDWMMPKLDGIACVNVCVQKNTRAKFCC